jgi:hypothetical protein
MHLQPTAAAARTASLTGSTSSSARSRTTCPKNPQCKRIRAERARIPSMSRGPRARGRAVPLRYIKHDVPTRFNPSHDRPPLTARYKGRTHVNPRAPAARRLPAACPCPTRIPGYTGFYR